MRFAILLAMFLMSACAHQDEWTKRDTILQVTLTAVLAADGYTTSKIQYHSGIEEGGPIVRPLLGAQPTTRDTWIYTGTLMISDYLISRWLPARLRPWWQGSQIWMHGYAVVNNCDLGPCP